MAKIVGVVVKVVHPRPGTARNRSRIAVRTNTHQSGETLVNTLYNEKAVCGEGEELGSPTPEEVHSG